MKAILISIRPEWVAKILNGEKTIEVRKRFPSDYVGWVYIYCTKGKPYITSIYNYEHKIVYGDIENKNHNINGKVVARFWCDKVEEIKWDYESPALSKYVTNDLDEWELCNKSCLTGQELIDYLGKENRGCAIHITKLEIFDKPKEINDFYKAPDEKYAKWCRENSVHGLCIIQSLTRAPQSWCYLEV